MDNDDTTKVAIEIGGRYGETSALSGLQKEDTKTVVSIKDWFSLDRKEV